MYAIKRLDFWNFKTSKNYITSLAIESGKKRAIANADWLIIYIVAISTIIADWTWSSSRGCCGSRGCSWNLNVRV